MFACGWGDTGREKPEDITIVPSRQRSMGSNSHGLCLRQEHGEAIRKMEQRQVCGFLEVCGKNMEILLIAVICLRMQLVKPWAENEDAEGRVLQI